MTTDRICTRSKHLYTEMCKAYGCEPDKIILENLNDDKFCIGKDCEEYSINGNYCMLLEENDG